MGRPIEKKYFRGDTGEGGEGVASLTVTTQGNNYSQGTTISIAASPIGGDTATGTITIWTPQASTNLSINRTTQTVTNAGTGYISAPAVTIVKPANVTVTATAFSGNLAGNILTVSDTTGLFVGMHQNHGNLAQTAHILTIWSANGNVEMSRGGTSTFVAGQSFQFGDVGRSGAITAVLASPSVSANTIAANAWTTSASMGLVSDINKQESSRQYYVVNSADSNARVRLVPTGTNGVNSPTIAQVTAAGGPTQAGEMTINATDSAGDTYWVIKLEHAATIVSGGTGTPGTQFADYSQVVWTLDAPTVNVSVQLDNND
jgi:hypothetical protein